MAAILLTSEKFVKSETCISDNIAGKYILPSIREAQEIGLRGIIGDALLAKLKSLVKDGTLDAAGNEYYKGAVDSAQYYLAYETVAHLVEKVTYKVTNFGLAKSSDEKLDVASPDEVAKSRYYWQAKADSYCLTLQRWLLENRAHLPELSENVCYKISANLRSAATCGINLGGARGKIIRRGRPIR